MTRKKTRKQKMKANPAGPSGKSRYALKLQRRKRAALKVGLPASATWPQIWAAGGR